MPKINNKTINYNVYRRDGGKAKLINDTSSLQLPSIEMITDTLKGSGIMGEIDMPTPGQIASMVFTMNIKASNEDSAYLITPGIIRIEVRWVTDRFDTTSGKSVQVANKAFVTCYVKKFDEGKVETGAATDGSYEYEVVAYQRIMDGKEILHINKLTGDFIINGKNYGKELQGSVAKLL
ncbi:MAG TPA: phage major tail tube protein [Negativicutes bacterium]|nr:phage major tail tube protein [Negativicutes bacterium]